MQDDIRKKIKKITIFTKRLMQSSLAGDYLSAFKGTGLEFDQLREYYVGDDIRFIDWKSSAKMNKMMVKQFIEERDRTVILAIDISASSRYSSNHELRSQTIAQIATAISCIATQNKDKVGALFFSDRIEKWIKPSRSKTHYAMIIESLFSLQPQGKKTVFQEALRFLLSLKQRNAIVFMISDWIDEFRSYSRFLKIARFKFDFIAVRLLDKREKTLPSFGLLELQDEETGESVLLDTRTKQNVDSFLYTRALNQQKVLARYKIDLLDLMVGEPFVNSMIKFFHQRIRRQV